MIQCIATTNLKSAEYTPYKYTAELDILAICHLPLILFAGSAMVSADMELVVLLVRCMPPITSSVCAADEVKFGEVVQAPPNLTSVPRKAKASSKVMYSVLRVHVSGLV